MKFGRHPRRKSGLAAPCSSAHGGRAAHRLETRKGVLARTAGPRETIARAPSKTRRARSTHARVEATESGTNQLHAPSLSDILGANPGSRRPARPRTVAVPRTGSRHARGVLARTAGPRETIARGTEQDTESAVDTCKGRVYRIRHQQATRSLSLRHPRRKFGLACANSWLMSVVVWLVRRDTVVDDTPFAT